jgi:hypothetical protein
MGCSSGDPEPLSQFGDGVVVQKIIFDETLSLLAHGNTFPWHRHTSYQSKCYPCLENLCYLCPGLVHIIILWPYENALHLVGVSSACFSLEIMRGIFRKVSGWVAIAVGILSFLGEIPSSAMLVLLACLADPLWYTGIGLPLRGLASEGQMNMNVKGSAIILIDAPFLSLVN